MRKTFFFLSFFVFITACNTQTEKQESDPGDPIVLTVDEFYANPDQYIGKEISVTGLVTHVCKHGGQKLFISGSENIDFLRIDVGEDIPEFDIEMEGTEAEFTGTLVLMDEEFTSGAIAEHNEHHADEKESGTNYHALKDKNYHLIAKTFKSL